MLEQDKLETEATPPESRRLDIQGLRAVAVILVVAFHSGIGVPGGFTGVDVFLVISGFVITNMLMRELRTTNTIRLRNFYTRRIKRLLPALALLTTVVVVMSIFFGSSMGTQQTTARTGLGATYLSANVVIYRDTIGYFSPQADTNPLLHTWTLSVEEQVYLIFPSLLLGSWLVGRWLRRGKGRGTAPEASRGRRSLRASHRGASIMLAAAGIASFVFCLLASFGKVSLPPEYAFFSSLTRVWEFAIGAALAMAAARLRRIRTSVSAALGIGGATAIVVGALAIDGQMTYPGTAVLIPVLGAAAVIASGFDPRSLVSRALGTRPIAAVGDISYSWYLWHWPAIVFAAALWPNSRSWALPAVGVVSLLPAWLSTTLLENPIRRKESIRGRRVVLLALVCTLIPTAACLGLAAGARVSWGNEAVAAMQLQVGEEHAAEKNDCVDAAATGSAVDDPACGYNTASLKGPHIYLVGNSVAAMYAEALIGASRNLDIPLTLATSNGCFFAGEGEGQNRQCSDLFTGTINKLTKREPGIVVMSSTWDLGLNLDVDSHMSTAKGARERANLIVPSLTEAITKLQGAGHRVLIVLPTPRFFRSASTPGTYLPAPDLSIPEEESHATSWKPRDCSTLTAQTDPAACGATVPLADVEAAQAITMAALDKIAERTGSTTLNLRDRYCWTGLCRTNDGDRWMYRDGIHISVDESEALAPTFTQTLRKMIREHWGAEKLKGS